MKFNARIERETQSHVKKAYTVDVKKNDINQLIGVRYTQKYLQIILAYKKTIKIA